MKRDRLLEIDVNPGDQRLDGPFVVISNPWSENGYFMLHWLVTSAELRELADKLEKAEAIHREMFAKKAETAAT